MKSNSALEQWDAVNERLRQAGLVCLFLDYDGTLTPIVETPDKALLPPATKTLLQELSKLPSCKIAVISGRAIEDLKEKIHLKNIVYVGNHGFQIAAEELKFNSLVAPEVRNIFERVQEHIKTLPPAMQGVFSEDKGATLSIHYRLLDEKQVVPFRKIMDKMIQPYLREKEIRLVEGKKTLELRPAILWDKGEAVKWLLTQYEFKAHAENILPVYLGDDATDEDAFVSLRDKGITIIVGENPISKAQYFLQDTQEVFQFLSKLLEIMKEKAAC